MSERDESKPQDENKLIAERRAKLARLREQFRQTELDADELQKLLSMDDLDPVRLRELFHLSEPDLARLRKLLHLDDMGLVRIRQLLRQDEPDLARLRELLPYSDKLDFANLQKSPSPFPNDFRRSATAGYLQRKYAEASREDLESANEYFGVCGRLIRDRGSFLLIQGGEGEIQLYVNRKVLSKPELAAIKDWDLGDIVAAVGPLRRSGKGDLYIDMELARLLVKSLRPLPDKFHGLADQETRYRQRYVDLIVNPESRDLFRRRSDIVNEVRAFMREHEFMEVETPMMQPIPGGALARPFVTHHNTLGVDMYLRVAPELYLKRLVAGGFERVFELNRNFRNEGVSARHNPEFTMLEFYWVHADYRDGMDLTEQLLRQVCERVLGSASLSYQGESYDLSRPFERMTVFDSILKFNPKVNAEQLGDEQGARAIASGLDIPLQDSWGLGKVQIEIFEKTVEHRLMEPTFIIAYPAEVSPLAQRNNENPFVTDRFEFFMAGREIANGFSELNDSEDQAERFRAQVAGKDAGDEEAMHYDEDYITALEYSIPPTAGVGIGIDRLVMLLTDAPSIRDVLLFPHMRPSE